jgi:ABC-type multidrug transport system fused ATPase/permease subunit
LGLIDLARSEMTKAQRNMLVLTDVPRLVLELALYIAIMVALLAILASTEPDSALPVVALYVIAGLRILPAISRGLASLTQLRTGVQMGAQVTQELARVKETDTSATALAPSIPARGALRLSGVTYSYDDGLAVLRGLDMTVGQGEYVAVVGQSGAGKSTLLAVVLGLLRPDSGTVEYAGTSVSGVGSNWLEHVSYLPQDVFILDDSVATNVALGYEQVDEAAVWRALDEAAIAPYIRGMPDQLETRLGESGARLSVGQRQRLGLARALYRRPSLLVLDEPTASLDTRTEAAVMETIDGLKGQVSILAVSHRIGILGGADAVLSLSEGRLELVDLDRLIRSRTT